MKQKVPKNIQEWIIENKSVICASNVNQTKKQIKQIFNFEIHSNDVFDIAKSQDIIHCEHAEFVSFSVGYKTCRKNCKCYKKRLSEKVKKSRNSRTQEQKDLEKQKRSQTVKERYGTENIFQHSDTQKKIKKTLKKKYGVENPQQNQHIKAKAKNTIKQKYGVENVMQSPDICEKNHKNRDYKKYTEKIKNTKKQKYGCENFNNVEKSKQTNMEKYGVCNPSQNTQIKKKISQGLKSSYISRHQEKYNIDFVSHDYKPAQYNQVICRVCDTSYSARIFCGNISKCPVCYPEKHSKFETQVIEYIKSVVGENFVIETHDRKILNGKEIDILLPEISLGFECNGLYWHVEETGKNKDYHYMKTKNAHENGITLVHLFSDDWEQKNKIVKSRIKNLLGKTSNKIYAKNCAVKLIETEQAKKFMDQNHLDGYSACSVKIGLYYQEKLVSVMTFASKRFSKKSSSDQYEMIRYSSLDEHLVVGGASKLFKYFVKNFDPSEVVTFSDNTWGFTDFYEKIGFLRESFGKPSYFYIDRYNFDGRINRMNMQKHRLVAQGAPRTLTETQIATSIGLSKVWDCGHTKWIWKK